MRRAVLAALAALSLGSCAPRAATCEAAATREVVFTQPGAADTISTRSIGESCANAFGVLTISTAEGTPVWAWAAPLARQFGDDYVDAEAASMRAFLERWSQVDVATTSEAPEWNLLAPGQTTLDRLTYDDIRARNLPMLCHYSGTARQVCVFWEPGAASAGLLLERDAGHGEPQE